MAGISKRVQSRNICNQTPYKRDYYIDANGVETAFTGIDIFKVSANAETTYTLSLDIVLSGTRVRIHAYNNGSWIKQIAEVIISNLPNTFTTPQGCDEVRFSIANGAIGHIMINTGSEALPYEPYGDTWNSTTYGIMKTATDTLSLPATLYPNDTSITVGIKGNTGGVGDLVESGEHAGEYVIPIVCNSVITNIYRNAPLDISDSLTTTVSCTAGSNTFDVDTTVQPSEVTATFGGWHPVSAAHERSGGAWD